MFKKILPAFLSVALLLGTPCLAAAQAGTVDFTLAASSRSPKPSDTVTVFIGTEKWSHIVKGISGFNIRLSFSADVLEYRGIRVTGASGIDPSKDTFNVVPSDGVLAVLYMDEDFQSPIPAEGGLLEVTFRVKKTPQAGGQLLRLSGDGNLADGQLPNADKIAVRYPPAVAVSIAGAAGEGSPPTDSTGGTNLGASEVVREIDSLPDRITAGDAAAVSKAQKGYDELPAGGQYEVVNREKLRQAQNMLKQVRQGRVLFRAVLAAAAAALLVALFLFGRRTVHSIRLKRRHSER